MSLFTGAATIAAAAAGAGASVYGAHKAGSSADKAAAAQSESSREALAYTAKKDAQERADSLAAQKANYEQWAARERRLSPYRSAGAGASLSLAHMLGLPGVEIPEPAAPPAFLDGTEDDQAPPIDVMAPRRSVAGRAADAIQQQNAENYTGTLGDLVPEMVLMSFKGQQHPVPKSQVRNALANGATLVNPGAAA